MTRTFTFYLVVLLIILTQADGWAQIGMGGAPHPSAVLDLKSPNNNKAFYPPRLTSTQRLAIPNPQAGALVYDTDKGTLYLHNGQNWLPLATTTDSSQPSLLSLTANDGASGDRFGFSVAVSGDYAIVGAPSKTTSTGVYQGVAYMFVRSGTTWIQQQRLVSSDGGSSDNFGISVAISGDYAIVGAYGKTLNGNDVQGAAYVFVRSGTSWIQQQRLTASDGMALEYFGGKVALSGDYALIGTSGKTVGGNLRQGAAYIFVRSGNSWIQQQQLTASDGATDDSFGNSVALSGDYAIIGAPSKRIGSNGGQGAAYVFTRSGNDWIQQQRLTASFGATSDQFGVGVAISGEYALVGTGLKTVGSNGGQGAAYIFVRSGSSWSQQQQLTASDGAAFDFFGSSAAISGDYALLGANYKTIGSTERQGAAYLFKRSGNSWSQQQRLTDNNPTDTRYGTSVDISNGTYIIGGPGFQTNFNGKATIGPVN